MKRNLVAVFVFLFVSFTAFAAEDSRTPIFITDVIDENLPRQQEYVQFLEGLKGQELFYKQSSEGISANWIIKTESGDFVGVFRNLASGGAAEAEIQLIDSKGFFDLAPAALIRVETSEYSYEGYIQRFEKASAFELPTTKGSFIQQLQKVVILDLLIGNGDRHFGNLLAIQGKLIPIDHNISLLENAYSITAVGIKLDDVIPIARLFSLVNEPLWLRPSFKEMLDQPWTFQSYSFIQNFNAAEAVSELQRKFDLPRERLIIIEVLAYWLKKASAAGLSPRQTAIAVYGLRGGQNSGNLTLEGVVKNSTILLDVNNAKILTQLDAAHEGAPLTFDHEQTHKMFFENLEDMFNRRLDFYFGRLNETKKEELFTNWWFDQIALDLSRMQLGNKGTDEKRIQAVLQALDSARSLTTQRLIVDYGSVQEGLASHRIAASKIFHVYFYNLAFAESEESRARLIALVQAQLNNPEDYLIPEMIFSTSQNIMLSEIPLEEVPLVIALTKSQVSIETNYYEEQLGVDWDLFMTSKLLDANASKISGLYEDLQRGKISEDQYHAELNKLRAFLTQQH